MQSDVINLNVFDTRISRLGFLWRKLEREKRINIKLPNHILCDKYTQWRGTPKIRKEKLS